MKLEHKIYLSYLGFVLLFVLLLLALALAGCSHVAGKAGPDGKITEISYWQVLRSYDLHIKQEEKGLEVQVGASSEAQKLKDLLTVIGPFIGAVSTTTLGVLP